MASLRPPRDTGDDRVSTTPLRILACALLGLVGCRDAIAPPDPAPIVLAATFSETGRHAELGEEMARGYHLAVEMLNEAGGIDGREVQLVLRDDASDPETSARIYGEFVASGSIHALLGPFSSPITGPAMDVAEAAEMPIVTATAAAPALWAGKGRQWSVQMFNPAPTFLQGSVELASQNGIRTIALVYEDTQFPASLAQGVREAAQASGSRIVLDRSFPVGDADHEALAAAARDAGGELFVGGAYRADVVALRQAMAVVGYSPPVVSMNGAGDHGFLAQTGELARCVAGNAPWIPTIETSGYIASSTAMVQRYETVHGQVASHRAAGGFGAVELLAEAIDATLLATGEPDPAAIRDYLFSVSTESVFGPFAVYPLGDNQAGAQRALKGLQVQWQDDGAGGLSLRIIHPPAVAQANLCLQR